MDTLCQVDSNLQHSQLHPLVTVLLFVFRLVMRGHACTSLPTPPQTRAQTSCMLNTTWAEEHSEPARKGQNSVDGTGTCRLFTIGSIFVSFLSSLVSFIFPDFTVRFVVQCYEEPVQGDLRWREGGLWVLVRQSLCKYRFIKTLNQG